MQDQKTTTRTVREIAEDIYQKYWRARILSSFDVEDPNIASIALRLALIDLADGQLSIEKQIMKLNRWIVINEPQHFWTDSSTAEVIINVLADQRRQIEQQHSQLAQLDAKNAQLQHDLDQLQADIDALQDNVEAEVVGLLSQLAQLDADNAALTNHVNDDAPSAIPFSRMSKISLDYFYGIMNGRWTWRKLPKPVRLEMVQAVLATPTADNQPMTMSDFDAIKPAWMPTANGLPTTFDCTWTALPTLEVDI